MEAWLIPSSAYRDERAEYLCRELYYEKTVEKFGMSCGSWNRFYS